MQKNNVNDTKIIQKIKTAISSRISHSLYNVDRTIVKRQYEQKDKHNQGERVNRWITQDTINI